LFSCDLARVYERGHFERGGREDGASASAALGLVGSLFGVALSESPVNRGIQLTTPYRSGCQTVRDAYSTRHSHVNLVVIDSGWEGKAAKVLDDLAEDGHVSAWVKNAFLDFRIPYTDAAGESRDYLPDFIVRAMTAGGETIHLLLEVTGMRRDKKEKMWTVKHRWIPAVNAVRDKYEWPRWDFIEIVEDVRDARKDILKKLGKHEG
jgi:type III restriction enzyme